MKKHVLLLICLILYQLLPAQVVFCPPGAEWHYLFQSFRNKENERIVYDHDSVIDGLSVKVLKHRYFFSWTSAGMKGSTYIRQSGDTIFMRNEYTRDNWQILYNFNVSAGQGWTNNLVTGLHNSSITGFTVTVDSVKTLPVNGSPAKHLYVRYQSTPGIVIYRGNAVIRERLGNNWFMFNYSNSFDSEPAYILNNLCYTDDEWGTLQFTSKSCDFAELTGLSTYDVSNSRVVLFPNPASSRLKIGIPAGSEIQEIRICDISGKEIYACALSGNTEQNPDLSGYASGIYFVTLMKDHKTVETRKLVISN